MLKRQTFGISIALSLQILCADTCYIFWYFFCLPFDTTAPTLCLAPTIVLSRLSSARVFQPQSAKGHAGSKLAVIVFPAFFATYQAISQFVYGIAYGIVYS